MVETYAFTIPYYYLRARKELRKLTIEELHRMDAAEFRAAEKMPLVIVLDNVRSLHNVGSVLRTADAFRLEEVCLCGITATPPSAEIHKTALGAEDSVKWTYYEDTLCCIKALQERGCRTVAVEQVEGSAKLGAWTLEKADAERGLALVLGNEVKGVRQDVVDLCDEALEIPQYGTKHSLNVSVTAGIVIWEAVRQLQKHVRLAMVAVVALLSAVTGPLGAVAEPLDAVSESEMADGCSLDAVSASPVEDCLPSGAEVSDTLPDFTLNPLVRDSRVAYKGDSIPNFTLPTLYKYPPLQFKSEKERQEYTRLVRNIKKVLPLAKLARHTIIETYDYLQTIHDEKEREKQVKAVEEGLKKQYGPLIKRMSKTQGRILVKLIDRECGQSGYAIAKAFVGALKANVYQGIAFVFGQSLTKHYDPEGEDAEMERIVRLVESGQL